MAGIDFQGVYYTLVSEAEEKTFQQSIQILDEYFTPKANVSFERHVFRQMEQGPSETVDQFVCHLRQKAISCDFSDVDEAIQDQLIDRCRNSQLWRKFLEKTGIVSLTDLQAVARAMEALDMQVRSMEKGADVNALQGPKPIHTGRVQNQGRSGKSNNATPSHTTVGDGKRCYRCDGIGLFAKDKVCPARNSTCRKSSKVGHFAKCCQTKHSSNQASTAAKKVYQIQDVNSQDDRRNAYAFSVDDVCNKENSALVHWVIGGVKVKSDLIDSGASCNVMDKCTWEALKEKGIQCSFKRCEKNSLHMDKLKQ